MLAFALWTGGGFVLWTMRKADWEKVRLANANVVAMLEADMARNIELYDLSLQGVIENLNYPGLARLDKKLQHLILFDRAATAAHLGKLLVIDETGHGRFSNKSIDPQRDYSAREYFQAHRRDENLGLHISPAFKSRGGRDVLAISRRLNHPDGSFAGVVLGALQIDYFLQLFNRLEIPEGAIVALLHSGGTMIARKPFRAEDVGRDLTASRLYKEARKHRAGDFETIALTDGTRRLYSYRQVGSLPLLMTIGMPLEKVYAGWLRTSLTLGGVLLVLGLLAIALACLAARELRYRAAELKRRAAAEEQLRHLAATDPLTGLANRRKFDEALKQEWERARRQRTPLALLMIDADHFKSYNDRHGHQAGDQALSEIAVILKECTRTAVDLAARYGGEEFGVILPGASSSVAVGIAERIRGRAAARNVAELPLPTLSIGVAAWDCRDVQPAEAILAAADAALYEVKGTGRNCVALAGCIGSGEKLDVAGDAPTDDGKAARRAFAAA